MPILKLVNKHFEEYAASLLLAIMTAIIGLQVIMRYVFGDSLSWSEEFARYMFIWLVYIGISFGVKKNKHICIDLLCTILPKKQAAMLSILADALFLFFAVLMVWKGTSVAELIAASGQSSPALELPMWVVYSSVPVGFALVSLRLTQSISHKVKLLKDHNYEAVE